MTVSKIKDRINETSKVSPLLTFFPKSSYHHSELFGMEIASAARETITNRNTIFDISHLRRFTMAGKEATGLVVDSFRCQEPKMFSYVTYGKDGIIGRIAKNQYLLVDSTDGSMLDHMDQLIIDEQKDAIFLRTDLVEIAVLGDTAMALIEELTGLDKSSWVGSEFLPCDLGFTEAIVIPVKPSGNHIRIILDPSDAYYIFRILENINNRLGGTKEGASTYANIKINAD